MSDSDQQLELRITVQKYVQGAKLAKYWSNIFNLVLMNSKCSSMFKQTLCCIILHTQN